jgi:2-methylcitrate dehydratase PrpD
MTASDIQHAAARPTATARLAAFAAHGQIDEATLKAAVPIVLDTLAVTIAGGAEPAVKRLAETLEPSSSNAAIPSFWGPSRLRPDDAALLIGMASHVLDYDDVSMLTVCHPSAPILSALLAAAPHETTSGRDLLTAFVVGTETLIRLGQAMGFRHYALGFHATATLGTIGAAAACARAMGLDEARTRHALAIAASMASGLRKNFGSSVKSLHVGIAASNGLKAARLAAAGLGGAEEAFEEEGFLHAFSGGKTDAWPDELKLGEPCAIVAPGFEQKRYPCCYLLHKMIEGALALRRQHGLNLDDMASARVDMPQGGTKPLIHPRPRTGLNALFSGPYAICASLADGQIDLASFTDAAVLRPEIQARFGDVEVIESGAASEHGGDIGAAPVTVTVRTRSGESFSRTVLASPGSLQDPLTLEQSAAKWADCLQRARPGLDPGRMAQLHAAGSTILSARQIGPWLADVAEAVRT